MPRWTASCLVMQKQCWTQTRRLAQLGLPMDNFKDQQSFTVVKRLRHTGLLDSWGRLPAVRL